MSIPPSNPILQTQIDPLYTKKKSEILPPYIIRNTSPKVFQKCHNLRNSHHHHHHTFFSLYQDRQNDVYKKGKNCYDKPCFCMYVLLAREVFMYYSMFRQKDVLLHLLLLMQWKKERRRKYYYTATVWLHILQKRYYYYYTKKHHHHRLRTLPWRWKKCTTTSIYTTVNKPGSYTFYYQLVYYYSYSGGSSAVVVRKGQ